MSSYRDGYKAHVAVEPDTGIITGVDLTPANAGDGPTGVALLAGPQGQRGSRIRLETFREHLGARVLLLGTGLDTFGVAISGTTPFALPQGATPWPPTCAH